MKPKLLILGALAAALAIVSLELFTIYTPAGTIHITAPVKTLQRVTIHAPAEKVWAVFTNVNEWASWQKEITTASLSTPFRPGSVIEWETNGFDIHSQLQTVDPLQKIAWAGRAFGSFAIHVWTFEEKDGYTTVTVEESMEGWLVSLMQRYVQPNLHTATTYWLGALKKESEPELVTTRNEQEK